ncbi:hypothetical protein E2C01_027828 [Portunus trituberculatus]|uniref:Uncharacterized protein n=1 Tax=Portunus trituberculatus TaxID=210409 RepID=A0A5B7ELX8_PORTR|nr:hypothetical protein [Portunus trituberculatus]
MKQKGLLRCQSSKRAKRVNQIPSFILLTPVFAVLVEQLPVELLVEGGAAGVHPQHAEHLLVAVHPLQLLSVFRFLEVLPQEVFHAWLIRHALGVLHIYNWGTWKLGNLIYTRKIKKEENKEKEEE